MSFPWNRESQFLWIGVCFIAVNLFDFFSCHSGETLSSPIGERTFNPESHFVLS